MRSYYYTLDANFDPVPCDDVVTWGHWFETADRVLAKDRDEGADGTIEVSTVFLGLDHSFRNTGPPILWETLIFGGPLDGQGQRYASKEQALIGHQDWCQAVRAAVGHSRDSDRSRHSR